MRSSALYRGLRCLWPQDGEANGPKMTFSRAAKSREIQAVYELTFRKSPDADVFRSSCADCRGRLHRCRPPRIQGSPFLPTQPTKRVSPVKKRILVANRGEIAIRLIRAIQELDYEAIAVYESPDMNSRHLRAADEAIWIGDGPRKDYLDVEKIIGTALRSGVTAIHPGYGFLAENPDLARACENAGLIFIGPPSKVIEDLGSKVMARKIMAEAGIAMVPGTENLSPGEKGLGEAMAFAAAIRFPDHAQGHLGRRRPRHPPDRKRESAAGAVSDRPGGGQGRLQRRFGLSRKGGDQSPPCRGADPCRQVRQHRPSGDPRLLDPAPQPEAGRDRPGLSDQP